MKGLVEVKPYFLAAALLLTPVVALAQATAPAQQPAPTPAPSYSDVPSRPGSQTIAVLQGLDKTTARVSTFNAPVGSQVSFGTLRITVRDCRTKPAEEEPESAAYLEIDETLPGQAQPKHWFSGWMFASSPAVSALEHPVYDVWLLACKTPSAQAPAPATPAPVTPAPSGKAPSPKAGGAKGN
jgi:hypothetical protein